MAESYLGEIRMFAFGFPPYVSGNQQYMPCNGQILQIKPSFQALFAVIGNNYGGDGVNTFALPNLQGTVAIGSLGSFGQTQGSNNVVLIADQMPLHSHDFVASQDAAGSVNGNEAYLATPAATTAANPFSIYAPVGGNVAVVLPAGEIGWVGGNGAHENRQPALAISYMICVYGDFPPPPSEPAPAGEPTPAGEDVS